MRLKQLLAALPPLPAAPLAFPPHLLGAFRRRSISFCTGTTDVTTPVYWFQSRSFTIDLRLPGGADTAVDERQGWIADTLWDAATGEMSWSARTSYQPRDQWPEPARLIAIGNGVIEIAPSGAYVEDWRQQAVRGPLLGLRLIGERDGGIVVAGDHVAFALSRDPATDATLRAAGSFAASGLSADRIAGYEVSVALDGEAVTATTQPGRLGRAVIDGELAIEADGTVTLTRRDAEALRFAVDVHVPDMAFGQTTPCTDAAAAWLDRERGHLARHATILR